MVAANAAAVAAVAAAAAAAATVAIEEVGAVDVVCGLDCELEVWDIAQQGAMTL